MKKHIKMPYPDIKKEQASDSLRVTCLLFFHIITDAGRVWRQGLVSRVLILVTVVYQKDFLA